MAQIIQSWIGINHLSYLNDYLKQTKKIAYAGNK